LTKPLRIYSVSDFNFGGAKATKSPPWRRGWWKHTLHSHLFWNFFKWSGIRNCHKRVLSV